MTGAIGLDVAVLGGVLIAAASALLGARLADRAHYHRGHADGLEAGYLAGLRDAAEHRRVRDEMRTSEERWPS